MKAALILTLLVGQAAYAETTSITTTERSTPITCAEIGDMKACSKTVITAVTTTISVPISKFNLQKRKEGKSS